MPINSKHPDYEKVQPIVERTMDAFEGDVKKYVPKLSGQTNQEYQIYQDRASFYNLVERTVLALIGALMRKPYSLEYVHGDDPICSEGEDFDEFISECYQALLVTGRVGVLCDYNETSQTPYLVNYDATCITNWSDNYVIIMEHYYDTNPEDRYEVIKKCQYRELYLDDQGFYAVRIWRQLSNNKNSAWIIADEFQPTYRGKRLEAIPFVFINPFEVSCETYKPIISTLADINIEWFKIATDIAHGAHFLAIPTPWIAGHTSNDQQDIQLGTTKFIELQMDSKIGFLEFSGEGLTFLKDLLSQKEEYMYNLGSRMLQFKKGVESSDALQVRLGAEGAVLNSVASSLEEGLTQILEVYNSWFGITDVEVQLDLNKDFTPINLAPQQATILLTLFQKGVISLDTLLKRLYEGEIIDDVQEELEKLTGLEEPGEALEQQIEGPNSEEDVEEGDNLNRDNRIRTTAQ